MLKGGYLICIYNPNHNHGDCVIEHCKEGAMKREKSLSGNTLSQ